MGAAEVVAWGGFTLVVWLFALNFDRVQRWPTPWDRRFVRPERAMGPMKALAFGFAVLVTIIFGLMLAAVINDPPPPDGSGNPVPRRDV